MQDEQRSLSTIKTMSVWELLKDRCVRWQVITIAVVNISMQLSGIDAVSEEKHRWASLVLVRLLLFWMYKHCS